ncbi:hypothetical protein G9A89_017511 [Geosiphon pyriformis]|nr:hypothetical protein G9A89_017511 [Geosiphon pyriformis]
MILIPENINNITQQLVKSLQQLKSDLEITQNTTQATPFELIYGRTAILPVEIKSQEKQKEKHNNQLPDKPVEFKIGDKIFLHCTKAEKQWSGKFNFKWDRPFHIEEILRNRTYKLRLDNKILTKAAHRDRLKPYHNIILSSISNIPQLEVQKILVQPEEIP